VLSFVTLFACAPIRHEWQLDSTPQSDLVTSTLHNPRTPAATSVSDVTEMDTTLMAAGGSQFWFEPGVASFGSNTCFSAY
jgi:hypothetical protein